MCVCLCRVTTDYVEHKLKEIKSAFKKDYDRNNQYVKFFKKLISRARQRLMMMSRVEPRVGRRSRERFSVMV